MQCSAAVKAGQRPRAQRGRERRAAAAERASACGVRARATSGAGGAAGFTQLTIGGRTCSGRSRAADFCERDPVGHTRRLLHEGNAGVRGRGAARLAGATHRASRVPVVRPSHRGAHREQTTAHGSVPPLSTREVCAARTKISVRGGNASDNFPSATQLRAPGAAALAAARSRVPHAPHCVHNSCPLRVDARAMAHLVDRMQRACAACSRTAGHCRRLRMPAIAAAPSRVQHAPHCEKLMAAQDRRTRGLRHFGGGMASG